jgi:hypothetical protein
MLVLGTVNSQLAALTQCGERRSANVGIEADCCAFLSIDVKRIENPDT